MLGLELVKFFFEKDVGGRNVSKQELEFGLVFRFGECVGQDLQGAHMRCIAGEVDLK